MEAPPTFDLLPRRLAWPTAWISVALILAGAIGLWTSEQNDAADLPLAVVSVAGSAFFAGLGALIASRTGNRIGWLYLGIIAVEGIAFAVSAYGDSELPLADVARSLADPFFLGGLTLFVAIFLLFPTGGLASRRWRWVWWPYVAAVGVTFVGFAVQPTAPAADLTGGTAAEPSSDPNVLGIEALGGVIGPMLALAGGTILVAAVAGLVSLIVRYRRGSNEERQQIRWLVAVGALAGLALAATIGTGVPIEAAEARGDEASRGLVIANNLSMLLLVASVVIGIPLATALAILKYRLYDLDVVVRKAVVFAVLAAFVTVVYVGIVVGITRLVGSDSLVSSIAATAVVATLFQPMRGWATSLANRLVYGRRAEPYEVLSRFSDRVGGTYASEDVLPRMARVIGEGVGAERVEVWLGNEHGSRLTAAWPADAAPVGDGATVAEVRYEGERLGEVRVGKSLGEPVTPTEERLLQDLATQAGLVMRNVGLTVDLQARVAQLADQADELRASRMRIVQAHDAERRRLERNIHDGAQQHLVALAVKLRLARGVAGKDPSQAASMLHTLAEETGRARETLLDLASGIYPAALEEHGIAEALRRQGSANGARLAVEADGIGRFPIETEAAVYFVCLEAMQNAAKYADARHIDVRLGVGEDSLTFVVGDDGVGFDTSIAEAGSGLRNMRDRLSAFGGEVEITSQPGRGTTVRGSVPVLAEAAR